MDWNKLRERASLSYDEAMIMWPAGWTGEMKDTFFRALDQAVTSPSLGQIPGLDNAMEKLLGEAWKGGSQALSFLTYTAGELFTRPASGYLVDATDKVHQDCLQMSFADELKAFRNGSLGMRASPLYRLNEVQTFYLCCLLEIQVFGQRSSVRPRLGS